MISWRLIKAPLRIARSKGEGKNIGEKKRGYNFDHVEKEMLGHEIESLDVGCFRNYRHIGDDFCLPTFRESSL